MCVGPNCVSHQTAWIWDTATATNKDGALGWGSLTGTLCLCGRPVRWRGSGTEVWRLWPCKGFLLCGKCHSKSCLNYHSTWSRLIRNIQQKYLPAWLTLRALTTVMTGNLQFYIFTINNSTACIIDSLKFTAFSLQRLWLLSAMIVCQEQNHQLH